MQELIEVFRNETTENLTELEAALLELDQNPEDLELVAEAFRAIHTIKGSSAMCGFTALSEFTHHLENMLDQVRAGVFQINAEIISVILSSKDHIEILLENQSATPDQVKAGDELLAELQSVLPLDKDTAVRLTTETPKVLSDDESGGIFEPEEVESDGEPECAYDAENFFRLRIKPCENSFQNGIEIKPILRELSGLGRTRVTLEFDAVPSLDKLNPELNYLCWHVALATKAGIDAVKDVFIFVQSDWEIEIKSIQLEGQAQADRLGEILVDRGGLSDSELEQALTPEKKGGEHLQQLGLVAESQVDAALNEQATLRESRNNAPDPGVGGSIRVPSNKLDSLMDLIGELVIVQARMNQFAHGSDNEDFRAIAEDLDRLTTNLRDNTFEIRMLPIGTTFSRFRRLVRDLSKDLNKQIKLVTEGADTELDKMVIERLGDPLIHLIRNSVDHGIEDPETRRARNKPERGTITLSAMHSESNVFITIEDDGAGLDPMKLQLKAVEKGLIDGDLFLSDAEWYQLIFLPGFSTASKITDISGRGVGMDVVKKSIEALRGEVSVTSELGKGTKFVIRLPMTLAIIEGLMVAVSDERYVMPLTCVEECIELPRFNEVEADEQGQRYNESRLVNIRGKLIPYVRLRDWYDVPGEAPSIEQIVIVGLGDQQFGFCVDFVVGQYQTVLKSLGKLHSGDTGLAGATIMGNGKVAMIIDVNQLANQVQARRIH
jgi:two-component system chemotaxis sensor kinase CheA